MAAVISEKQVNFIKKLDEEREHELTALVEQAIEYRLSTKQASLLIGNLLDSPRLASATPAPAAAPAAPTVPSGRYAVIEDGVLHFFKVNSPEKGKWVGYSFVDQQISDYFESVRDRSRRTDILEAIASNPENALRLYGTQKGVCGCCGRTLTDEDSRREGIGPICAKAHGYSFRLSTAVDTKNDEQAPVVNALDKMFETVEV